MKISDTFSGNKVPRLTKWLYPLGTIARDASYTLVSLFFITYIQFCAPLGYLSSITEARSTDLYMYQMLVISAIIIVARIWDGFNDPIMGWIVEKCHFKLGKYKPWILIGGLSNAVVLFLMFYLQPVGWWYVGAFCLFYFFWDFTFTMNDIGYWSMLPSLSSDEKERNTLTTMVSVCASIGAFAAGGVIPLLVAGDAKNMYALVAAIIAILFAASQSILFFFCKEHKRDESQEKVSENTKFSDMFRLLKTNSQLRVTTIVILIYYLGSVILNGLGLNYFYFFYGYGEGGTIQFIFTVAYALGTIIAQVIFPLLIKKLSREKLFTISFYVLAIGYVLFFLYDLPFGGEHFALLKSSWLGSIGDMAILSILGILIFAGQGIFYLILLIMMTNTIEYNEWKDHQRRESLIFALRPLTAKVSSAIQQGVVALTLVSAGLYAIANSLNYIEVQKGAEIGDFDMNATVQAAFLEKYGLTGGSDIAYLSSLTDKDYLKLYATWLGDKEVADIAFTQIVTLKTFMCVLPLILFIISYILIKKYYFLNEERYNQMVLEISERYKPGYVEGEVVGDKNLHNELEMFKSKELKAKTKNI